MIQEKKHKIILAVTGASGSVYAKRLIQKLASPSINKQIADVGLVFSKNAIDVWMHELGSFETNEFPFPVYDRNSYNAPFASGSAQYNSMIVCPCSMGTLGRIACGISDELITRAADVVLKERRKLILVTRDTPLSLIHINNMQTVTQAGGIICPASPSFYSQPQNIEQLVDSVIDRVIDLLDLQADPFRWRSSTF